jgi:LPS export ABC transporter permease LptG
MGFRLRRGIFPTPLNGLKTVDRYILREWLKIFGMSIGVTLGLLILNDMYSNFGDLMDFGVGTRQMLLYYAVLLPSFIPVVLPIALLLSLLFSLGNMHRNNEFVALRACGFSIGKITRTIWLFAVLLSGLLLFFNARLVPWSVEQSRLMWENMEFAYLAETRDVDEVGVIGGLAFDNRREGRMWLMNRFNQRTYRGFGVAVHKLDDQRREFERIVAREATFDDYRNEWEFREGRRMIWDVAEGEIIASFPFDQLVDETLTDSPQDMILFSKRPRDLSLYEIRDLLTLMDEDNPLAPTFAVRYHGIWAGAFSPLIIVGLAIPFATSGVRVNPMVGISKSLSLFVLYYVFDNIGRILGEREVLQPMAAAWFPSLMMALLALWLYRRTL